MVSKCPSQMSGPSSGLSGLDGLVGRGGGGSTPDFVPVVEDREVKMLTLHLLVSYYFIICRVQSLTERANMSFVSLMFSSFITFYLLFNNLHSNGFPFSL